LTSLHKCPYCAEWVERGIDACPLCGKILVEGGSETGEPDSQPVEMPSEKPARIDPLQRLRQVASQIEQKEEPKKVPEPEPEPEPEPPKPFTTERNIPPQTTAPEPKPEPPQRPSLLSRKLVPPVSGEFRRSRVEMLQDSDDDISLWSTDQEPKPPPKREVKTVSSNTLRRIAVGAVSVLIPVGLLVLALGPGKPFIEDFVNSLSEISLAGPTEATPSSSSQDGTPFMAPTLPPADATEESEVCLSWDEVTEDMRGEVVCVEGVVRRWFSIPDMPFVAIFTEDVGTFAIVDRLGSHPEVRPGTCLQATGTIEVMRGPRPFIDIEGEVVLCDPE
jgi:hypothetical protein